MKKIKAIAILILLLIIIIYSGRILFKRVTRSYTEVIEYKINFTPQKRIRGECWTTSLASDSLNPKNWRCSSDNYIYDPCFEYNDQEVICVADPERKEGVLLELTKPLPKIEHPRLNNPWIVVLETGDKCFKITGAAPSMGDEMSYYVCENEGLWILGELDTSGPQWKAKVAYLKNPEQWLDKRGKEDILKTEIVNVVKVWK